MIKSKKIKVLIISILCILTITIGLSYGYYLLNKIQENNNIAGSKCFNLEFTNEKNAISLDNMYPISDEEGRKLTPYSFTITNTCDMLAGYTVNMEMLEGTTLNSKYLDVMVNNEEIKLLTNYELTNTVITGSTESRILAKGTLAYNDSVDYTVRFWMDKDVEDTESMNKIFKSKIVISATPSTWNPKDAGYDTLHDAILANEYQTTPADAISRIEAKGSPDLSKTAPIIKWQEKIGENITKQIIKPTSEAISTVPELSDLSQDEQYMYICTTKNFDSNTAKYTLSNCSLKDPTTLNYTGNVKYYFATESITYNQTNKKLYISRNNIAIAIYQITSAVKINNIQTTSDISYTANIYDLSCITLTETELESDKSDKGLYQALDDYGTTYYYRGNVANNNVYFAGYYWQIIRINGDDSIRIMYNGTEKNATGVDQSINGKTYQFSRNRNNPTFVGYMYGNQDATTYDEIHANITSSLIKNIIDTWYKINIIDNGYGNYVSSTVGFCGDRTLYSGDGISISKYSNFGAYGRYKNNTVQFICPNTEKDLYTTTDSDLGNKSLIYPVALITADELFFAGMSQKYINKLSWAYSTQNYFTMSPASFNATTGVAYEWYQNTDGLMYPYAWVSSQLSVRSVINLKSDVKIIGGIGTSNDPYVIDTSK